MADTDQNDQKDVETRGQAARRGPGKASEGSARKRSSLDFDVTQPVSVRGGYMEENSGPIEPFYQYGTLDTSGTGGGAAMADVTPVFEESRARAMVTAARALDSSDPTVPRELVTLPEDSLNRDDAVETLMGAAKDALENPVEVGGLTPSQREAAEEYDDSEGGRASLGGQTGAVASQSSQLRDDREGGKDHDQSPTPRDLDGDGADDKAEVKQDVAEAKASATQGSTSSTGSTDNSERQKAAAERRARAQSAQQAQ